MLIKIAKGGIAYKGIKMMTSEGVHEAAQRLIESKLSADKRRKLRALDLASGQGALTQRLLDLKFKQVDAWELEIEQFLPKKVEVKAVDLNKDFPKKEKYDVITACEIIEHLENPYHFLSEISSILNPNGILILSTPNVESAISRVKFISSGNFRWFNEGAHREWGHITPVTSWVLDKCLRQAKLQVVARTVNSPDALLVVDSIKNIIQALPALILYPFMKGLKDGDINVWMIGSNRNEQS